MLRSASTRPISHKTTEEKVKKLGSKDRFTFVSFFGGLVMFKIVKREEMAEGTVILNEIEALLISRKAKPGQFVILKAKEEGERIPLTIPRY